MLIYSYAYDYDIRLFTILYPFDTPRAKPGPTQLKLFMTWGADRRCLILGVLELFGKSGLGWKIPPPHLFTIDNRYLPIRNLSCPIFLCQNIGATATIYLPIPCDFCCLKSPSPQAPKLPRHFDWHCTAGSGENGSFFGCARGEVTVKW